MYLLKNKNKTKSRPNTIFKTHDRELKFRDFRTVKSDQDLIRIGFKPLKKLTPQKQKPIRP